MENILRKMSLATVCALAAVTCYAGNNVKTVSLAEKAAVRCVNDIVKVSTSKNPKHNAQRSRNLYTRLSELKRSNPLKKAIEYLANKIYPKGTRSKKVYSQREMGTVLTDFSKKHLSKEKLDKTHPTLCKYVEQRAEQAAKAPAPVVGPKNVNVKGRGGKQAKRGKAAKRNNKVEAVKKVNNQPTRWWNPRNWFRRA